MPKVFKYGIDDELYVKGTPDSGNKVKVIEQLTTSQYDYRCKFENGEETKFYESELIMYNFEIGQFVRLKSSGEVGQIEIVDEEHEQVEIEFIDGSMDVCQFHQVEHYQNKGDSEDMNKNNTYFEDLGTTVGQLVDKKQQAYGDSVSKTYKLMQIFMDNYDNGDDTYTIPKSLLKHILLQVRIIDKQNRIFSNPDGDLMQENPYMDTVGYGLLGTRMCESDNK